MEFPKYVAVYRKGVVSEAIGCVIVGSLEPFSGQAVHKTVADAAEDVGAKRFRQGTKKTGLEGLLLQTDAPWGRAS